MEVAVVVTRNLANIKFNFKLPKARIIFKARVTRPKKKMQIPFYFLLPPDSVLSLEPMVPQKWFTYQNFPDSMRKTVKKLSNVRLRKLKY